MIFFFFNVSFILGKFFIFIYFTSIINIKYIIILEMEQNRFFKVMSNSSSYSNINGIEDVKGKKMSFEKSNNNP